MMRRMVTGFGRRRTVGLCLAIFLFVSVAQAQDGQAIVDAAWQYYRHTASTAVMNMTIHRPAWERTLTMKAWTKGQSDCIFFIVAPPKDEGNGTLKKENGMWMYNPKVNRVIKLPPSMMSQAWMGSDFSYDDLAKSASIVTDYTHTVERTDSLDGKMVYIIRSVPKPGAPVVWGLQRLRIRDDHVLLGQEFYDEDLQLVKTMTGTSIEMLGGKPFPRIWTMRGAGAGETYSVIEYRELAFQDDLPDDLFTVSALTTLRR